MKVINVSFVLATTILLATYLTRAAMEEGSKWVITAVIVWHVLFEFILIVHDECTKSEKGTRSSRVTTNNKGSSLVYIYLSPNKCK